ncbi:MAG: BON domain-containing protein [Gammaproteobacteria bacterium]|nr:BON domain-containing protein [Gammaproteobacteria bacterium]
MTGSDPGARSPGVIIDDEGIENVAKRDIRRSDPRFKSAYLVIVSHNGTVLLAGQVESDDLIAKAQEVVEGLAKVKSVHNELTAGGSTGYSARSSDAWITTKVKSAMVSHGAVDSDRINVTTVDSVVYLMGSVSREQADFAVQVAQSIQGIKRIVKVFEYLD